MRKALNDEILDIALTAGELMLKNGGETYRTEETAVYTALSLGAKSAEAFVTPTVVMVSFTDGNGTMHTGIKRILSRDTNLSKVAQVNDLSRRLKKSTGLANPEMIEEILHRINSKNGHSKLSTMFMGALSSCFFSLMFGGGLYEALFAFCFGLILRAMVISITRIPGSLNGFMVSLLSGISMSVLSDLTVFLPLKMDANIILIGTMMQVVPGLALVNSIRDIINGDLVSGSARLLDACMTAVGLSIGSVAGVFAASVVSKFLL